MLRERFEPWLMIRDDTRHSSLSDVRLDCRYCSLSFIFRGLVTTGLHAATVKYVHVHIRARIGTSETWPKIRGGIPDWGKDPLRNQGLPNSERFEIGALRIPSV